MCLFEPLVILILSDGTNEMDRKIVLWGFYGAFSASPSLPFTTEGLEIKFFIAWISLLKGSLYRGFSVSERYVYS
jgi:hypothetical protein